MGGIAGALKTYHEEGHFRVCIDGFKDTDFSECSEPKATIGSIVYRSGGEALAKKQPGSKIDFADITLKRGVCDDYDFYLWFTTTAQFTAAAAGSDAIGLPSEVAKRSLQIKQIDRAGQTVRTWTVRAFPKEYSAGSWNGESKDKVTMESLVLEVEWFDLTG
jgi:phage tail-like protein